MFPKALVAAAARTTTFAFAAGAALTFLSVSTLSAAAQAEQHAAKPQRVISTDAGITAIVEALDAADSLVAVDVTSAPPAGKKHLPRVGYHRALSAEGLMSLKPELVLASEHAGPEATLATLRRLGVTVRQVPAPLSVADLRENIAVIGTSLHRESSALALQRQLEHRARAIAARAGAGASALIVRANDGVIRVAGIRTAADALLGLAGVKNLATFPGYRSYSVEALLAEDPEVLVIATAAGEAAMDWVERYPMLQHSRAVREGRVFAVSGSSLVGGLSLATLGEAESLLDALASASLATR